MYVFETTFSNLSATVKWVVSAPCLMTGRPGFTYLLGVGFSGLIRFARRFAYCFEINYSVGTGKKSGSPRYSDLSA